MHEEILKNLQAHYRKLPIGFPELRSGLDRAFLNVLFTENEAHAALHLTPHGHTPDEIAHKLEKPEKEVVELLETMVRKGLITREVRQGKRVYILEPFIPGIYEFQGGIFNEVMARLFEVLLPEYAPEVFANVTPWARVVPAEKSLPFDIEIAPYERASEILKGTKKIALTDCICRKERKLLGGACDRPKDEICFVFNRWAEVFIERGIGKEVSVEEGFKAIDRAEKSGLARNTLNIQQNPQFMCQCCGCCCGVMRGYKEFGLSKAVAHSNFIPIINKDSCNGCGDCVKICIMAAISLRDDKAKTNGTKCIGCGLCATSCHNGSIVMRRKAESKVAVPPVTWDDLMTIIAHEKGRTYFYK